MSVLAKKHHLEEFLKKIPEVRILVVGDLILDHFVTGLVKRISPEAPVPVVEVRKEIYRCGGAGNVCFNIKGLGGNVTVAGIIGDDSNGAMIKEMLEDNNIGTFLIPRSGFPTSIKTRVIASSQQLLRINKERNEKISNQDLLKIQEYISAEIDRFDGVIVSDYGKGVIIPSLISFIVELCHKKSKIVTVDPKVNHFSYYKFVDCLTPNLIEASQGMHTPEPTSEQEVIELGKKIIEKLNPESLIITRGKDGMTIFTGSKIGNLKAISKEVFDVTGAGDTVIAVLTLGLVCGFDILKSAIFANFAAGVVVQKLGTANVSTDELKSIFRDCEIQWLK